MPQKILVIQTAFIGDAILSTSLLEKLHGYFPDAHLDFLIRKGNESLFKGHPFIHELLVWDKSRGKYASLIKMAREVRKNGYDIVVNPHRFASSGFITWRSKAKMKLGFDANPLSWTYTHRFPHRLDGPHEVERNQSLIAHLTNESFSRPKLYISTADKEKVKAYQEKKYICIAPTSVWQTKQWPMHKWIELINAHSEAMCYLIGAPSDTAACEEIRQTVSHDRVINLCGKLSLLQSAALMSDAEMNYVNDSAPLHLASSMNAPVRAIFNSTVPLFGFTPLSDNGRVIQTKMDLDCRPCGVHGHKTCPKGHFNCAESISIQDVLSN